MPAEVPDAHTPPPSDPGARVQAAGAYGVPPLWFTVPEGLHALPVAATPEERGEGADAFVRELFPGGADELWRASAPYYAAVAGAMAGAGLAYSALGIFAVDEGIAHCSLTAAAVESDHHDPEVAARGIHAILADDPLNDVQWMNLPAGPAVGCVSMREVTIGAETTATGESVVLTTAQLQVHVPFPTGPYTVVFTLDTAALEHWEEFCELMLAVLLTLSFTAAPDAAEIPEAVDAS